MSCVVRSMVSGRPLTVIVMAVIMITAIMITGIWAIVAGMRFVVVMLRWMMVHDLFPFERLRLL